MTHLAWQEVAEGAQARAEARCAAEGHAWEAVEGVGYACRWCMSITDEPANQQDWKARALSHATVVRALLSVKDLEPDTAGAAWLAEAQETFKLAGVTPGVGIGARR